MEEAKQIAEWLDALDRPNKQMLRAAVDGLIAALPDSPETGKNLQDLLRDSQRRNRWPIAYILAHLPQPPAESLEILLDALDDSDPDVRWAVILLLARLTKPQTSVMQLTSIPNGHRHGDATPHGHLLSKRVEAAERSCSTGAVIRA